MKKYIGLHIVSLILTIGASVFCGIMIADFLGASDGLEQAASLTVGIFFALIGAVVYLIASILGAVGWGLSKKQGSSVGLFVVETLLPIVLIVVIFAIYLI